MTKLTFFGAVNVIGGNKFLLEDRKTKVFLDFGMSFDQRAKFYDDFMQPRKYNGMGDFFEIGLAPKMPGLYREDLLSKTSFKSKEQLIDGVLITHAHTDHTGLIPLLHPDMPVYLSETTKLILKAMQDTGAGGFNDFVQYREAFTGLHYTKNPKKDRKLNTFKTGDVLKLNDLKVEPVHVDHSIPGAHGMIIETSKGAIVYTGDLRLHGNNPGYTEDFISIAKSYDPIALITEGTRINQMKSVSEQEVRHEISRIIKGTKGLVVANFPPRDLDRLNSFFDATVENGRKLVISLKQAYLLSLLANDSNVEAPTINDKNILIYAKRKGDGWVKGERSEETIVKDYDTWERDFLFRNNSVNYKDVMNMQAEIVLYLDSFSFGELIDIKPIKDSRYIYSLTEPFNDEMELDFDRMKRWVEHFKLQLHLAHASGHADFNGLKHIVEGINPKMVIPVHTEHAEMFKKIAKNVKMVEGVVEL